MTRRSLLPLRVLALGVAAGLLALPPLAAQSPAAGAFSEVIDVRVVNLEVVVTDKDGVRVSGLTPADFELKVDGVEVPIEYFTEVLGGSALQPGAAATGTLPALAPGEPVGTSYLVFLDEYFSRAVDRDRILEGLIEQLPLLGQNDRMAIVAFDGRQLEMLSTWSQSTETLERVLKRAKDRPARGLQRDAELRGFEATRDLRDFNRFTDLRTTLSTLDTQLDIEERQHVDQLVSQLRRTVLAATSALRSFARPPGRKVMLLAAGGWPFNPVQWVVNNPGRPVFESGVAVGEALYQPLIDAANRLSYTLYPIDVAGFDTDVVNAAQSVPFGSTAIGRAQTVEREDEEEATLTILAERTGGRAQLNAAGMRAFERAVEDTRSYYWIGFTPTWKGDDANHKVRIEARRRGLQVRTRGSFSDLSRSTEVSMMVESTLLFGNAPSSETLDVQLGAPTKAGRGKVEMELTVLVPTRALTFLPAQGGFVAEAELRVAALDEDGNTSEVPVVPLRLAPATLPGENEVARYRTKLKLRKKKHDLVVSLYDRPSGSIMTRRVEVHPR